jgi:aryl-alcohol dehydrogenase-like predicted oxidoreductase
MSSVDPIITGCWQLSSGHHGPLDEEETQRALANHVSLGMGTLDCGDIYTGVEARIGRFTVSEHCPPGIRARLRIHTKFVPDLDRLESVDVRYVEATLRRSIRRLRLPAGQPLDLVQFHWWALGRGNLVQVAQHLGSLADPCGPAGEQLLLQVGLTNFDTATTRAILDAGVKVASTQIQFSLLDRRALHSGLLALCKERGVSVLCYGALAGGLLSERWLGAEEPEAWSSPMTAETRSLTKYFLVARDFGPWQLVQTLLSTLDAVAKHIGGGTTIAQVSITITFHHFDARCMMLLSCRHYHAFETDMQD